MKIGNYGIPTHRLETLLAATKKIYEHFKGDETSAELIAGVLKYSPNSGTFGTKMGDLRAYGLIEGRGKKLTVTELGKQATFGEEGERSEALQQIVRNVELWRILLDKYGLNIKKENFWVDLVRITGAERLDAQKKADSIRKAYLEAVEYIKTVGEPTENPLSEGVETTEAVGRISPMEAQPTTGKTAILYIKYPDRSETRYEIKTEEDYQVGESLFKAIRFKLGLQKTATTKTIDKTPEVMQLNAKTEATTGKVEPQEEKQSK